MDKQLATDLQRGCDALELSLDPVQRGLLLDYLGLLIKWNKAYNLTAVRDPGQMVSRHLLDSNGKKTRFLFQVKTALRLDNMTVHHERVESFRPERPFDAVLSRAFASLQDMMAGCRHLLTPEGRFLAMKGVYPTDELEAIKAQYDLQAVYPLAVPGLAEQRHLVEIKFRQGTDYIK